MRLLTALALSLALAAPALAHDEGHGITPQHYVLILPENLPHVMHAFRDHADQFTLTAAQQAEIDAIFAEIPPKMHGYFAANQQAEAALAADILNGTAGDDLAARLDALAAGKRAATETQIGVINRLRATLDPAQFAKVLALTAPQHK